jgi:hypothetical protein
MACGSEAPSARDRAKEVNWLDRAPRCRDNTIYRSWIALDIDNVTDMATVVLAAP